MDLVNNLDNKFKIVVIGGGTGISNILRGLKKVTNDIVAIVTVADDGGGSGALRNELGILPPGDIRNCLISLANTEPIMKDLLRYRFNEGNLKNQNFGNLFIAAMIGITSDFEEAIKKTSEVLAITGKVLPVTTENVTLRAELFNGNIVEGESKIPNEVIKNKTGIKNISIIPSDVKPLRDCVNEILNADIILLGPGSLYTSILPNLKIEEVVKAINMSKGLRVYISNIMTQPGETDGYTLSDHVNSIFSNTDISSLDYVIANDKLLEKHILKKYESKNSNQVICDYDEISKLDLILIKDDLVKLKDDFIRHDHNKLACIIRDIMNSRFCSR